jgi:hypothetical protein
MNINYSHTTLAMVTALCMASPCLSDAYGGSQSMREKLKSTIGGAEYVVTGEVTSADGNTYSIKTTGGETIQLEVTDNTNMVCKSPSDKSQSRRTSTSSQGQSSFSGGNLQSQSQQSEQNIGVSEKQTQSQQSQEGQQSKGFRIGDCPFEKGEIIKAELTDVGTVTFMRSVDDRGIQAARAGQGTPDSQGSGRSTEEMGLPQQYVFLPAGALGSMQMSKEKEQYKVTTSDGEDIGQIYKVIINNQGDPAYAIIRMKDDQQLKPVPWQALQVSPETQSVALVISRAQIDQLPGYSPNDMSMRSIRSYWELAKEEKDRRVSRQEAARFDPRGNRMYREDEGRYDDSYDRRQGRSFRDGGDQDRRFSSRDRDRFQGDRFGDDRFREEERYRNFDDDRYFSQGGQSFYSQGREDSRDRYFDDDRREQQRRSSEYDQYRERY